MTVYCGCARHLLMLSYIFSKLKHEYILYKGAIHEFNENKSIIPPKTEVCKMILTGILTHIKTNQYQTIQKKNLTL